jgi:hypothetical protein
MRRTIIRSALVIVALSLLAATGAMTEWAEVRLPTIQNFGPDTVEGGSPAVALQFVMRAAVTMVILIAGLFVILSKKYTATDKHWAYGVVGTVVGFWLKS